MPDGVGRDSAEGVLRRHHVAYRVGQYLVKRGILRIGINEARAAHHLAPVFSPPAVVGVVRLRLCVTELGDELCPQRGVEELILFDEANGVVKLAREVQRTLTEGEHTIGLKSCGVKGVFTAEILQCD